MSDYIKFLQESAKRRKLAQSLRDKGFTTAAIAQKLGISRQRVYILLGKKTAQRYLLSLTDGGIMTNDCLKSRDTAKAGVKIYE